MQILIIQHLQFKTVSDPSFSVRENRFAFTKLEASAKADQVESAVPDLPGALVTAPAGRATKN